jgi:hypothetical protein
VKVHEFFVLTTKISKILLKTTKLEIHTKMKNKELDALVAGMGVGSLAYPLLRPASADDRAGANWLSKHRNAPRFRRLIKGGRRKTPSA